MLQPGVMIGPALLALMSTVGVSVWAKEWNFTDFHGGHVCISKNYSFVDAGNRASSEAVGSLAALPVGHWSWLDFLHKWMRSSWCFRPTTRQRSH